jgi:hypothetical protein
MKNIYIVLYNSLYVRISTINKDAPEIATTIFFSLLLTFNVNCVIFYFFNSLKFLENKNYNFALFTLILVLNYFYFIKNKKSNYNINDKKDRKKFIIIGYVYTILSFVLIFMLLNISFYYILIFLGLFLLVEIIFEFSRL